MKTYAASLAVALVPAADAMRIRVSIVLPCTGIGRGYSGDDLLVRVPLLPDGSFSGSQRVRSTELGSAKVYITGVATPARADGTVEVRSYKRPQRCRSGTRPFIALPVDASAPLANTRVAPIPGALYVGLSTEKSTIPFGAVARVSADGTHIHNFFVTQVSRCRTEGRLANKPRYSIDRQSSHIGLAIANGRFKEHVDETETRADHRRGIDYYFIGRFTGIALDTGIRATATSLERYRAPGYVDHCKNARHMVRLVPVG